MGRVAAPSASVSSLLDTSQDVAGRTPDDALAGERSPTGAHRWAEVAWIALVVAVTTTVTGAIAGRSSWQSDDFLILQDAARGGYTYAFLVSQAIAHFSPGHRLVSLVLFREAPFDHDFALAFLLVVQACSVVLVQRIVRWFAGPVWWSYALALAYGLSPIVFQALEWFTAGLLVLPSAALWLASLHAYLNWRRTGRRAWLIWSVVAFAGSLAFYVKAVLVPVYLVLVRVLLLDDTRSVRENARRAAREWRVWALYGTVAGLWLVLYTTRTYTQPWQAGSLAETLTFARVAWLETVVPGALGLRISGEEAWSRTLLILLGQAALVAAIVLSVRRRRAAWRPWVLLGIGFALGTVTLLPRLADFAPEVIGRTLRYQTDVLGLVPVVLAAAFARRGAVERRPRPGLWRVAGGVVAVAAVCSAAVLSMDAISDESPGRESKRWLANVTADVERLQAGGTTVTLLDKPMPRSFLPGWIREGSEGESDVLPLFLDDLRFDAVADPTFRVRRDGRLERVRFDRQAGGDLGMLIDRGLIRPVGDSKPYVDDGLCLRARASAFASMELLPPRVLRGQKWYLRTRYSTGAANGVLLAVNRGVPYPKQDDRGLAAAPAGAAALVELGEIPNGPPTFGGLRFDVPPGGTACFTSLEVGAFVPTSARP